MGGWAERVPHFLRRGLKAGPVRPKPVSELPPFPPVLFPLHLVGLRLIVPDYSCRRSWAAILDAGS